MLQNPPPNPPRAVCSVSSLMCSVAHSVNEERIGAVWVCFTAPVLWAGAERVAWGGLWGEIKCAWGIQPANGRIL